MELRNGQLVILETQRQIVQVVIDDDHRRTRGSVYVRCRLNDDVMMPQVHTSNIVAQLPPEAELFDNVELDDKGNLKVRMRKAQVKAEARGRIEAQQAEAEVLAEMAQQKAEAEDPAAKAVAAAAAASRAIITATKARATDASK